MSDDIESMMLVDDAIEEEVDEEIVEFEDDLPLEDESRLSKTALVSSLLFVSTKPVPARRLASAVGVKLERLAEILESLQALYTDETHGISLQEVASGWQLRTAPEAAAIIRRVVPRRKRRLSRAAAESLAIIAYKQPVDRAEIESIRGVDALPTLKTLLDSRMIRIVGKKDAAGHPALYGTTTQFLEKFGLKDLSELPSLHELEQLLEEPGESELPLLVLDEEDVETRDEQHVSAA